MLRWTTRILAASALLSLTAPTFAETAADDAVLTGVRSRLATMAPTSVERDRKDRDALAAFYAARHGSALWISSTTLTPEAAALTATLADAKSYGLEPKDFRLPKMDGSALAAASPEALADAELQFATAALLYARHARGGRIPDPTGMLNSNLDRRPQWLEPKDVLDGLAAAKDPGAYLVSLHPKHPQFERLRQAYLAALPSGDKPMPLSTAAKRLRANMEMWRWMWTDMGDLHVFNNIPEFMQRVYKDGKIIRSEKIVAGMIDKQSSIFSRPLKYVVLRPAWKVPESIKVKELWPSLLRGGGYMRQYGLQLENKTGQPLDWRKIDWTKVDIRSYDVVQPPGPRSVLGHVKFSFPSQHTIFMHDTPDKWMFRSAQRTLSHGCLRVSKPMDLAEIVLDYDKGWNAAKVAEVSRSGPLNNEIAIDKEVPIHLVYFTAWVDDSGRLQTFRDVYGHEKRVTQALDGQWDKINKGRDHLAPVQNGFDPAAVAARAPGGASAPSGYVSGVPRARQKNATLGDFIGDALGLGF